MVSCPKGKQRLPSEEKRRRLLFNDLTVLENLKVESALNVNLSPPFIPNSSELLLSLSLYMFSLTRIWWNSMATLWKMSSVEKLFVQIFERKKSIVDHVKHQANLFDHRLASKLHFKGIPPPPWLFPSESQPQTSVTNGNFIFPSLLWISTCYLHIHKHICICIFAFRHGSYFLRFRFSFFWCVTSLFFATWFVPFWNTV